MLLIFRLMSAIFLIIRIPICNPYGIFWKNRITSYRYIIPMGFLFVKYPMSRRDNLLVEHPHNTHTHIP